MPGPLFWLVLGWGKGPRLLWGVPALGTPPHVRFLVSCGACVAVVDVGKGMNHRQNWNIYAFLGQIHCCQQQLAGLLPLCLHHMWKVGEEQGTGGEKMHASAGLQQHCGNTSDNALHFWWENVHLLLWGRSTWQGHWQLLFGVTHEALAFTQSTGDTVR